MRGSRDFGSIEAYETYCKQLAKDRNYRCKTKYLEELKYLQPLPARLYNDPKIYSCTVNSWSTISIKGSTYSVPSKYIRKKIKAVESNNEIELYYDEYFIQKMPKLTPGCKNINYRHIILGLIRKPGAFENYRYREEMFPSIVFRKAYDKLKEINNSTANKEYLQVLYLAAVNNEYDVSLILDMLLESNIAPSSKYIQELLLLPSADTDIKVVEPNLSSYDKLISDVCFNTKFEEDITACQQL